MEDENILVEEVVDIGDDVVGGVDSPTDVGEGTPTTLYNVDDLYYISYINCTLLFVILLYLFVTGMFGKGWRH